MTLRFGLILNSATLLTLHFILLPSCLACRTDVQEPEEEEAMP